MRFVGRRKNECLKTRWRRDIFGGEGEGVEERGDVFPSFDNYERVVKKGASQYMRVRKSHRKIHFSARAGILAKIVPSEEKTSPGISKEAPHREQKGPSRKGQLQKESQR